VALLAAHLNDAGISVYDSSRLLYREPGFALLGEEGLVTGLEAHAQARMKPRLIHNEYWSKLRTTPLPDRRFAHLSAADLVSRQLEDAWTKAASAGDSLLLAVPAYMDNDNLSLLLGIAAELSIPVAAMADAAIAATRRCYEDAVPVHVDLSLHSAMLTRIRQAGHAQLDRAEVIPDCGVLVLQDAWIRAIAEAFVRDSRFDPLHTAATEQALQDRLPGWLAAASSGGKVALEVEYRGVTHRATLEALDFVAAAAPAYHRIASSLRALYRADETPALQLTDRAARLPGLADMLAARVGGDVYLLEAGAAARGLLARCREPAGDGSSVSLIRQLPWDQAAVAPRPAESVHRGGRPTHVLLKDRAYRIDARPLTLGSQPVDGERCIDFGQEMPGVSRRHCSLAQENGQCIVRDFSRYGTFLNGHRIDGSAVLQVGDRIRLGTPGFELLMISAEEGDGA
jgi:FHA domain